MNEQDKKDLTAMIKISVPEISDEAMGVVFTYIMNYIRKREDQISLQNIGIIAANALKKKSHKPDDILGAVTVRQMERAGVDIETLKLIAKESNLLVNKNWLTQQLEKEAQGAPVQTE